MCNTRSHTLVILLLTVICIHHALGDITFSTHDLKIKLEEKEVVYIDVGNNSSHIKGDITLIVQHSDIIRLNISKITIDRNGKIPVEITATGSGHSEVYANTTSNINVDNVILRVTVYKVAALDTFSLIIGWVYFVAWSVSFYPQIYSNWKRKSVVGLNFDFIALNVIGFTLYGIFNLGLYYIPEVQNEYFDRYPRGLNPVKANDIVFAVHATFATLITIIQCFIYERNEQRISITARIIMGLFAIFLSVSIILTFCQILNWLDFLYYCSYVKLTITLIKYIPQAYMNYKRKSTVGWSIENIFLDFTGGSLSMLQMIVDSYNYDDWRSIFGDPTKFGLGLFSVAFDIFFIIQHYILYRNSQYEEN